MKSEDKYRGFDEDENEEVKYFESQKTQKPKDRPKDKSKDALKTGRKKNAKTETALPKDKDKETFINLKERITINGEQIGDTAEITPAAKIPSEPAAEVPKADGSVMPSFLHGVLAGKDTRAVTAEKESVKNSTLPRFDAEGDDV